jgi:hypothetical protein
MNYKKLFGYGVLIWAAAYLVASAFVAYKVPSFWTNFGIAAAAVIAAGWAGRKLHETSAGKVFRYSIGWVAIGVLLDVALTTPFTGWGIFSSWSYWLGYLLIAVVPIFTNKKPA